ncbi:MAG: hypothetical protein IJD24_05260, partial [Agathobacter sp.]|nr:hypothetical protein [Agathobacter sp.]
MKKLLAILLAGMMVFSLAACGGTNDDVDVDEPGTEVSEDVVAKVGIVYGDDETPITLTKPDDAEFTLVGDDPLDSGDMVGLCATDYSWDAEVMGYKYFEGIGSNVPFVDYYFAGSVDEEEYTSYEEEIKDLGISYEGKPVKVIRYTFKEVDDEEEYKEIFVGFEYKGTDDQGLFGVKI